MPPRIISATRLATLVGTAADQSPAYRGIADALRVLVADGRVPVGTRLPSERDLTAVLGVSRTTVTRAYDALREAGYAVSRQGSGTVAALPGVGASTESLGGLAPVDDLVGPLDPDLDGTDLVNLTCASLGAPAGTSAAYAVALDLLPRHLRGTGYHPLGLSDLREAIAARYAERGLATSADQVMVTSGAVAATAVVARAVLGPGDRVLMDSPTYPNAVEVVRRSGARVVPVPLDPHGWDLGSMTMALRQTAPRAAMLLPDFQNPTGLLMDDDQRATLAGALAGSRTLGIVDETLVELPTDPQRPMPAPFAAHLTDCVAIGSASKAFWGGLRIGWLRAPEHLMPALLQARVTLDLGAPVFEQLVLTELMRSRAEILAERLARVAESRRALVSALRNRLPQWHFREPDGGLSLWVQLPPHQSSTALTIAAERVGVALAPGPRFAVEPGLDGFLRIPFSVSPEILTIAVERLADLTSGLPHSTRLADQRVEALVL